MEYTIIFAVLLVLCVCVQWYSRQYTGSNQARSVTDNHAFAAFQKNYLIVYFLVMGSDWLQGPYVYKLYQSYNFSTAEIGQLFIAGFLSSGVFGTFIGSFADKYGRRFMAQIFCLVYIASCITKLFPNYWILMLGRLFGGIATSLLFSVFEAWMVYEHNKFGYPADWLSQTFSTATFGNGVVAVASGLVADVFASQFGYVAPFMLALCLLVVAGAIVTLTWSENYGDAHVSVQDTLIHPFQVLMTNHKVLLLGLVQSLFEGSMYTFVFMWTPALQAKSDEELPFGVIFASYMVCVMIGSAIFSMAIQTTSAEQLCRVLLLVAAASLCVPVFTLHPYAVLLGFLLFEICCGMWWPTIGTLRGQHIPEATRAGLMNFFRVPLNFLVCIVLLRVSHFQTSTVFLICTVWLGLAATLHSRFLAMPVHVAAAVPTTEAKPAALVPSH